MVSKITPPQKPTKPKLESVKLPDKRHTWKKEDGEIDIFAFESGDYHNGPKCVKCDYGDCHHCNESVYDNKSCLREQAKKRNADKQVSYIRAMEKYKNQMEYYNQLALNPSTKDKS